MQTVTSGSKWLRGFLIAALYVSVFGCATPPSTKPVPAAPPAAAAPAAPAPAPEPVVSAVVTEPAPVVSPILPPVSTQAPAPHIALLLPLKSKMFAKAANAVQQGFLAASSKEVNGLPVRVYPCNDESTEVNALYQQALRAGAVAVAGPLTRGGVAAL